MSEIDRIVDQLERAYRGEAWHGPSMREVLEGVDAERASARPIAGAHTIQELVVHVIVWENEVRARLEGKGRDDVPPEEDWPEGPAGQAGQAGWSDLLQELDGAHDALVGAVTALDDAALDEAVGGRPATAYHLLHGVIQHNLYHAGQIALLKKAD